MLRSSDECGRRLLQNVRYRSIHHFVFQVSLDVAYFKSSLALLNHNRLSVLGNRHRFGTRHGQRPAVAVPSCLSRPRSACGCGECFIRFWPIRPKNNRFPRPAGAFLYSARPSIKMSKRRTFGLAAGARRAAQANCSIFSGVTSRNHPRSSE